MQIKFLTLWLLKRDHGRQNLRLALVKYLTLAFATCYTQVPGPDKQDSYLLRWPIVSRGKKSTELFTILLYSFWNALSIMTLGISRTGAFWSRKLHRVTGFPSMAMLPCMELHSGILMVVCDAVTSANPHFSVAPQGSASRPPAPAPAHSSWSAAAPESSHPHTAPLAAHWGGGGGGDSAVDGKMHDYFCNYTVKQQLVVRTGGKQLVVNQDRNILKKKCMGSHWELNPRPSDLSCRRSDH